MKQTATTIKINKRKIAATTTTKRNNSITNNDVDAIVPKFRQALQLLRTHNEYFK